jgi:2-methylisocitrate lyase-like PEP mutase family enzyme
MTGSADTARRFLALHHGDAPLLLPNAWDRGSAKLFEALGFDAVATTSAGHAATLGRLDGRVTRDEALAHARDLVDAVGLPVSADFENAFADAPADVAANITLAVKTGLAGCSVEDYDGTALYDAALATERVAAATEAAHAGGHPFVITARAENFLRGNPDLADTIARLQSFQEAGADVLYAPGLPDLDAIRAVVAAVDRPVNVLALPGAPPVAELRTAGVKRISVGSGFSLVAQGAAITAAKELLERGTYDWWSVAAPAFTLTHEVFES